MTSNQTPKSLSRLIIALCLAQFCISADIATMAISTSALIDQFSSNVDALKIAGTIYPLVGAALMLISGIIGLYIGWRNLLIVGLLLGLASSLSKIYAPSIEWITYVSRTLAGLAGVAVIPSALALVVRHFSDKKRASVFGLLAASTGLAAALIPLISGWLIDNVCWTIGFYITCASYATAALCALLWIPSVQSDKPQKFDLGGCLLSAAGMLLLILGLLKSPEWGLLNNRSPYMLPWLLNSVSPALWLLLGGGMLLALFVSYEHRFERKHDCSLIPAAWFTNRQLLLGVLILAITHVIFGGFNFTIVAFLQVAINMTAFQTGTIILVFAISLIVFSVITPTLFSRYDHKFVALGGFGMCGLGAVIIWLCTTATSVGNAIYLAMVVFGAGLGMLSSQSLMIVTKSVSAKDAQRTGGLQATVKNVGLAIGIAVIAGLGQTAMEDKVRKDIENNPHYSLEVQAMVKESKAIPYITDDQLLSYLSSYRVSSSEMSQLLELNSESRRKNFHFSLLLLTLFSVVGMVMCSRLRRHS